MENENKPRRVRMKESGTCATVKPNSFSLKKRQQCYVILHLHLPSLHSHCTHFSLPVMCSIRYNVTYLQIKVLRKNNVTFQSGGWVIDIFRITLFKLVILLLRNWPEICNSFTYVSHFGHTILTQLKNSFRNPATQSHHFKNYIHSTWKLALVVLLIHFKVGHRGT